MGLRNALPGSNDEAGRRASEFVTDRIERASDVVEDVSSQARDRARQTADTLADSLAERVVGDPEELLGEVLGDHGLQGGIEEHTDRALEGFLRRYGLTEERLDDRTLESIRNRLAAEFDVDAEEVLDALRAEGGAESRGDERGGPEVGRVLSDVRSGLRSELGIDPDRPPGEAIEDVLSKDAIGVAHGVERAVDDALSETSLESRSDTPEGVQTGETPDSPHSPDASGTAGTPEPPGPAERTPNPAIDPEGNVRSTAVAALVAAALVGSRIDGDSSGFSGLVEAFLGGEGSPK